MVQDGLSRARGRGNGLMGTLGDAGNTGGSLALLGNAVGTLGGPGHLGFAVSRTWRSVRPRWRLLGV